MIVVVALALLLLAGCAATPTGDDALLQQQVEMGVRYLRTGDYAKAQDRLNRALALNPKSGAAHAALGLLHQAKDEPQTAEAHFKAALRHEPNLTRARNNYGAFLYDEGRYVEAAAELERAAADAAYGNRASVFENLGMAYHRSQEPEAAERAFLTAVEIHPSSARALLELAGLRLDQGRYAEAREFHRTHAAATSASARSLWLCVRIARALKDADEEASCALALRNIHPGSAEYQAYQESM